MALFQRVFHEARPLWGRIGGILAIGVLATPLSLLMPVPLKIVVDSVLGADPAPWFVTMLLPARLEVSSEALLWVAVGLLVLFALLTHLQLLLVQLTSATVGERLVLAFRSRLFRHAQRLSLGYHDTRGTADSVYRIQYDAPAIQYLTIDATIPLVTSVVTLVAMVIVVLRIDWQLALVALTVTPFLFGISKAYQRPLRGRYSAVSDLETRSLGVVQEVMAGLRVIKAFGTEDREQQRFLRQSGAGMRARIRLAWFEGGLGILLGLVTALGSAAVLLIGARHVQSGVTSLGDLLLVMAYLSQLYVPLQTISKKIADIQGSLNCAERAFALLDTRPEVRESPRARPLRTAWGMVEFKDVWFAYERNRPVLKGISFTVPVRTRVGVAGTTGAGKSTIVSLLTRFYDPTRGQVLLDGIDLRDYQLADVRRQFSIVLQEPMLFSTTIAENIAYALPGASHEEIVEAARAANGHDFIMALPRGYQTEVGERGMRLSGGERQRISLARAFLRDAPVLILDEPTSSVDVKTEALIMEAMERLMRGRTTFMIAHRLSTLESCDLRLQVEHGRIVDISRTSGRVGLQPGPRAAAASGGAGFRAPH
jgi:ATP-binding cassette subfamily B protein